MQHKLPRMRSSLLLTSRPNCPLRSAVWAIWVCGRGLVVQGFFLSSFFFFIFFSLPVLILPLVLKIFSLVLPAQLPFLHKSFAGGFFLCICCVSFHFIFFFVVFHQHFPPLFLILKHYTFYSPLNQ